MFNLSPLCVLCNVQHPWPEMCFLLVVWPTDQYFVPQQLRTRVINLTFFTFMGVCLLVAWRETHLQEPLLSSFLCLTDARFCVWETLQGLRLCVCAINSPSELVGNSAVLCSTAVLAAAPVRPLRPSLFHWCAECLQHMTYKSRAILGWLHNISSEEDYMMRVNCVYSGFAGALF